MSGKPTISSLISGTLPDGIDAINTSSVTLNWFNNQVPLTIIPNHFVFSHNIIHYNCDASSRIPLESY